MLYTCDALLPRAERYASLKFRRVSRRFRSRRLDYGDAIELAAFLDVVPVRFARWLFDWDKYGISAAQAIQRHYRDLAEEYAKANHASVRVEDGIDLLRLLMAEGWNPRFGGYPKISKRSLRALRHDGVEPLALARELGMTVDQVKWAILGRPDRSAERNRAIASVAVG